MSYDGQVNFGLIGDYDAMADLELLAGDLEDSLSALAEATGARPKARRAKGAAKRKTAPAAS
jgi:hypothetical protein